MILSHIHYPPQSPVVSTEMIKMDLLPALTARISSGGSYQRAFTQRPGITKESGDEWWQKWWRNTHRLQRCVFISTFAGYKKLSMFMKPWKAHPCVLAQRIVWHLFVHILASQIRIFQKSLTWEWVCHTVCDWKPWYWWTASPPFNMVLSLPPMLNTPQSNPWFGTVHLGDIKHGLLDNSPLCRWVSHCLHIHNLGSIDIEDGKLTIPNYWIVVCYIYIIYIIYIHIYAYIHIYIYTNIHIYKHTYIHIYIYTYIHIYIYTYTVHHIQYVYICTIGVKSTWKPLETNGPTFVHSSISLIEAWGWISTPSGPDWSQAFRRRPDGEMDLNAWR